MAATIGYKEGTLREITNDPEFSNVIERVKKIHNCSDFCAMMICAWSFGKHQIPGIVLYKAGFNQHFIEFLMNEELQNEIFEKISKK